MILTSLQLKQTFKNESVIPLGVICKDIYFIYEQAVDVYFNDYPEDKAFVLKEGSYFGEISMIYDIRNTYQYICQSCLNHNSKLHDSHTKVFCIKDDDI